MKGERYTEKEVNVLFGDRAQYLNDGTYYMFFNKKRFYADSIKDLKEAYMKEWKVDDEDGEKKFYY